jgi:hypothetical protein
MIDPLLDEDWDECLPAAEILTNSVPEYHMEDDEVENTQFEYSTRHPADWVISGPLAAGAGPGRRFQAWEEAERWAKQFYGKRLKGRINEAQREGCNRWAFLIKGPRGQIGY